MKLKIYKAIDTLRFWSSYNSDLLFVIKRSYNRNAFEQNSKKKTVVI